VLGTRKDFSVKTYKVWDYMTFLDGQPMVQVQVIAATEKAAAKKLEKIIKELGCDMFKLRQIIECIHRTDSADLMDNVMGRIKKMMELDAQEAALERIADSIDKYIESHKIRPRKWRQVIK